MAAAVLVALVVVVVVVCGGAVVGGSGGDGGGILVVAVTVFGVGVDGGDLRGKEDDGGQRMVGSGGWASASMPASWPSLRPSPSLFVVFATAPPLRPHTHHVAAFASTAMSDRADNKQPVPMNCLML